MIAHEIEGGYKEPSDIRRVSVISNAADVSVILADVVFGRGIRHIDNWFVITFSLIILMRVRQVLTE